MFSKSVNNITFSGEIDRAAKTIRLTKPFPCDIYLPSYEKAEVYHSLQAKELQAITDNIDALLVKLFA